MDLKKGEITPLKEGAILNPLPEKVYTHPCYSHAFGFMGQTNSTISRMCRGNTTLYFTSDQLGNEGRVEIEGNSFRFFRKFASQEEFYQVIPHSTNRALETFTRGVVFVNVKEPGQGLSLDEKGHVRFKIDLSTGSVIDCRGKKESKPYDVQTFQTISGLKKLERFEHPSQIVVFSSVGQLEKIEFVRYGLSFTYRDGKFYSDAGQHTGYFIDLNSPWNPLENGLILRPTDPSLPLKLVLPNISTFASKAVVESHMPSPLRQFWLQFKSMWSKTAINPEEFQRRFILKGPEEGAHSSLKGHTYNITAATGRLVPTENKTLVESTLSLLSHAIFEQNFQLALLTVKQMKISLNDLNKGPITSYLRFLNTHKDDDGNVAAIKIGLALRLKQVMGNRLRFLTASEKLDQLIVDHCKTYLRHGRRLDQHLLLDSTQFNQMAKIVHKLDPSFHEENLKFFLQNFPSLVEPINTQLPPYHPTVSAVTLEKEGQPLLFSEEQLKDYFSSTPITLPNIVLKEVELEADSCEKEAIRQLKAGADRL